MPSQEVIVKEQIDLLAKIQEKDLIMNALTKSMEKGPERIKKRETAVNNLDKDLAIEKEKMDETQKLQRQIEMDVEQVIERIKASKSRLLAIKNNKEYQAVLTEIDKLESSIDEKEEKILACMEKMEQLRDTLREKEQNLLDIKKQFEEEIEDIEEELNKTRRIFSDEEKVRKEIANRIESNIIQIYERLKSARGGIAVAKVENATCTGCNMSIPPQMYNELQKRDELRFCPNCERIIYWNQVEKKHFDKKGMSE
jgi:predicted  nucleic acid-binding Zn-ribbon protein